MRGVESVVGGYLLVALIVGLIVSAHVVFTNAAKSVSEQVNEGLEKLHQVAYPPVLSLKYVNESYLKLVVVPLVPIYVESVVVEDASGSLIYEAQVGKLATGELEIGIPAPKSQALIYVTSNKGLTYYYVPRLDPGLARAPDYIKNKVYVDEELIRYISSAGGNSTGNGWSVLWDLGYKLYVGKALGSDYSILVSPGPAVCEFNKGLYSDVCNLAQPAQTYTLNFLTYNRSTSHFATSGSSVTVYAPPTGDSSVRWYFQVYRVIRVSGEPSVKFAVGVSVKPLAYAPVNASVVAVAYVYEVKYSLPDPVTIHQNCYLSTSLQVCVSASWLKRVVLGGGYAVVPTGAWLNRTYTVELGLSDLALNEAYIIVGVEVIVPYYSGAGVAAEITVLPAP